MPFWVVLLVLDCAFLLFWSRWRLYGNNERWDVEVTMGHFVVSVMFALDVVLRFSIYGLQRGR
jgi:hypothetical protein